MNPVPKSPFLSVKFIAAVAALPFLFLAAIKMFETVGAREVVVKQGFMSGALTVWSSSGTYAQNWGGLTRYDKSSQYWFSANHEDGFEGDGSIKVRFNDGGHAQVSGSLHFDLPLDTEHMTSLHTKYGSPESIVRDLLRPVVTKSVYMTGPLMTSKESYAERRNDLIQYVEDQIVNGVYKTVTEERRIMDPLSGHEKDVTVVKLVVDKNAPGGLARQEKSVLETFGIKIYGVAITAIDYDPAIEKQIQEQQKATMEIQQKIADAKKAEQNAITIGKEGEAKAAKAKWEQETLKAQATTKAEQEKEVAVLSAEKDKEVSALKVQAAQNYKLEQTLIGEGDASRKKAAMLANGALEQKLDAWVQVNKAYAEHFGSQPLVPTFQMGGGGGENNATGLMQLLMAKTARDLSLEISPKK